jgi:hypothetical protein
LGFQLLEEQISTFQSETSGGDLSCPDLLFHPFSGHLEASSSRVELLGLYILQPSRRVQLSQGGLDLNLGGKEVNLVSSFSLLSGLGRLISSVLRIL